MSEEPWEFPGLINLTPEQRARYEAEEAIYLAAHAGHNAHRWSMTNSLTMHCGKCCPPPPLFAQLNRPGDILHTMKTSARKLFPGS